MGEVTVYQLMPVEDGPRCRFSTAVVDAIIRAQPGSWVGWWGVPTIELIDGDAASSALHAHVPFPNVGGEVLVLSRTAAEALHSVLCEYGELLPLADPGFIAFHCTNQVDALDTPACDRLSWGEDSQGSYIWMFGRLAFKKNAQGIFVLPQFRTSEMYFGEDAVSAFMASGVRLDGARFSPVLDGAG